MSLRSTFNRVATLAVALLVVTSVLGPAVGHVAAETESNDTRENAEQIQLGNKITGDVPADDSDWFAFTVQQGETINISAAAASGDGATDLTLFTPDGNSVAGAAFLSGETAFFGTTARTSGTYYVKARATSPNNGGPPYNFTVNTYRTDTFESNEKRANATEIAVGEKVSGTVSLGDRDWFAFTVQKGETINVSAADIEGTRGNDFALLTPDGDRVASTRLSGGSASFGTTATTSGTYYLQARGTSPERGGDDYNVTVNTYRTDAFEPNERRRNATRLYENPFPGDRATISLKDRDWFAFTVEQGATINVSAADIEGTRSNDFTLYTPDGDSVAGAAFLSGESTSFGTTATTSGTYYLQARGTTPERGGDDYNVTVAVPGETLGLPNDRFERGNPPVGNNDRTNASDVDPGTFSDLGMVDDDRDVFALDLDAGERLIAEAGFTHAENDLALALRDSAGTTLASADSATDDERLAFTATEAGTHYLRVTGAAGAATRYDLAVTVLRQLDVTVGPGADSLDPGTTATYEVALTEPSAGLAGVNLSLATTNATVLRISDVTLAGGASGSADVATDGSSATVTATDLATTANGTVPVATVTVAAETVGEARLGAGATVTAPGGLAYPLGSVQNTTISVGTTPTAPDLTGDGNPATDPDDDGVYEDITGDGSFDIFDVQAFLDRFNSAPVQNNSALFNFDASGGVNIFDVQALLDEV